MLDRKIGGLILMLRETIHLAKSADDGIHTFRQNLVEHLDTATPESDSRELWADLDILEFHMTETLDALYTIISFFSTD